jgi:hypothetical protein
VANTLLVLVLALSTPRLANLESPIWNWRTAVSIRSTAGTRLLSMVAYASIFARL